MGQDWCGPRPPPCSPPRPGHPVPTPARGMQASSSCSTVSCSSFLTTTPSFAVELAADASEPRNPELEVIKAPDARPPLPKIHRKVAEPVQPRQRSTRVRVRHRTAWVCVAARTRVAAYALMSIC